MNDKRKSIIDKDDLKPRGVCSLFAGVTALRTPSPVEDFYCKTFKCVESKDDAVVYMNDIYMILNQKRLDSMTLSQFQDWLNHDNSASQLSSVRAQLSDEQLHQFIKSRYIQHPAELSAWVSYLDSHFTNVIESMKDTDSVSTDSVPTDSVPTDSVATV